MFGSDPVRTSFTLIQNSILLYLIKDPDRFKMTHIRHRNTAYCLTLINMAKGQKWLLLLKS